MPVLVAFAAWNAWVIVRNLRHLVESGGIDPSLPAQIGWWGLARLLWVIPWQDEWGWCRADLQLALIVGSLVVFGVAVAPWTGAPDPLPD